MHTCVCACACTCACLCVCMQQRCRGLGAAAARCLAIDNAFKHCVRHVCRWGELEDAMGLVYGTAVQLHPSMLW